MENKNTNNVLRVLVIGGIIAILIFLSIGIVRIIPRALNALASASVSISSLFKNDVATSTVPTGSGFVVSTTTAPSQPSYHNASSTNGSITIQPATSTNQAFTSGGYNYNPSNTVGGNPDLAVTITSRGVIDRNSGQYIETNNFNTNDTVIVKFKIENRGTSGTGPWNLRVNMPANNNIDRIRDSNGNGSLPPGTAVTGQAIFDQPIAGTNTVFSIAAEPQTSVVELDQANNIATTYFNVSGYNNGGINTGYQSDISGQIIAIGILDGNNNFVATTNLHTYDRVAIKFRVSNTGSVATPTWNFRINFSNGQSYTSNESSLAGNTSLTYIVGLQNIQQGYNTANIYLDSGNNIVESNEGNNVILASFNTTY
ncbi:MAG: CARDB domain-containing protein [Patescibacteria group bacterium]